jgi:hypothetical protein
MHRIANPGAIRAVCEIGLSKADICFPMLDR